MTAMNNNSVSAAIYARTSSPNQRFNYSIDEQVNQCWDYCDKRQWTVRYVFIDECQSAKTVERTRFQLMMEKARTGEFNVIAFWKLDRFCRSLADLINVEKTLGQWKIQLCSVTELIDTTTPVGRFNYRNLASAGELEREIIGERARLGMYGLAREHKWPNPHPPMGYDKDENRKLVINKKEAALVKRIYHMYINEKSMPQVAFELNTEGFPTKRGRKWNARAVRDILQNKIYIGKYSVATVEYYTEEYRIVPGCIFEKANQTMSRYTKNEAKRPPMSNDRRTVQIESIHKRYLTFLKRLSPTLLA